MNNKNGTKVSERIVDLLLRKYPVKDIETSLIKIFLEDNQLDTKNELILEVLRKNNEIMKNKIKKILIEEKIELDLVIIEKFFELLHEEEYRKISGTFYTPTFIVDFITRNVINKDCKIIDLSCGCGAFLIGSIKRLRDITNKSFIDIIENNIYGIDISKESVEKTKILLTLFGLIKGEDKKFIKFNIVSGNSLILNIEKIFPDVFINGGFDVVLGNPPYSKIQFGQDLDIFKNKYRTISKFTNDSINMFIPFLELMLKISKDNDSKCGFIVPLSIAYSSINSIIELRKIIMETKGKWQFSFYDRSPDSLFGDSIKTRNSILFLFRNNSASNSLSTTKLLRWNSNSRNLLFNKIVYQNIQDFPIIDGIPKISTDSEFTIVKKFKDSKSKLKDSLSPLLASINGNTKKNRRIYFYSTAYNWLPIFRDKINNNPINFIRCNDEEQADLLYPVLSSKLVYWYWLVYGDGFHLNKNFILNLPINPDKFSAECKRKLIFLGKTLNNRVKDFKTSKINKGKRIDNYNMLKCMDIISSIDKEIIKEMSIKPSFNDFLKSFIFEHISADRVQFKNRETLYTYAERLI